MKLIRHILPLAFAVASVAPAVAAVPEIVEHIQQGKVTLVMPAALAERLGTAAPAAPAPAPVAPESAAVPAPAATTPASSEVAVATPATPLYKGPGYRIQIFSDNNARTAKGEARHRQSAVASQFPELATYVVYNSPYWRLRVGNFRTQDEAASTAAALKAAFPAYSKEIRVVRDRISIAGD